MLKVLCKYMLCFRLCALYHIIYIVLFSTVLCAIIKWGKKHFIHSEAGRTNSFSNFISSVSKVKSCVLKSEVSLWKISFCSCTTCLLFLFILHQFLHPTVKFSQNRQLGRNLKQNVVLAV